MLQQQDANTKEFLLKEILNITKECLVYANQYDVEKLTEAIRTRESYVGSLMEFSKKQKTKDGETEFFAKFFKAIEDETDVLMEKMQICVAKFSNDLASLYDGKQVIKYF